MDEGLKSLVKALSSGASKDRLTMSGLLNALDGVASVEGKLIFATTSESQSSGAWRRQATPMTLAFLFFFLNRLHRSIYLLPSCYRLI